MNSLSCFTFLLVISTAFSTPFGVGGGVSFGGNISGGGSVGSNGGKSQGDGGASEAVEAKDEPEAQMDDVSDGKEDEPEAQMDDVSDGKEELETPDSFDYHFFPVSNGEVHFEVRAPHDAHLAFTTGPVDSNPMYEIIVGGWKNTRTVLRKNKVKKEKQVKYTTKIITEDEFRGIWVRVDKDSGTISAGRENEDTPVISWVDPEPVEIKYIGVRTCYGAKGTWRMKGQEVDKDGNPISTSS